MKIAAPNLNSLWGTLLVEELVRSGVSYFCLPPGSRCAPLTAAVASHPSAKTVSHFDERGAAFHALGYGRATNRPAAVITTSGTAVANIWPAVVEASVDRVPLLLLTADRPPELRDTGANQTIDQDKFFAPYVRWQIDLPCPDRNLNPRIILTAVDQAVYRSRRQPEGPVHINCMFREPLAPLPSDEDTTDCLSALASWQDGNLPFTEYSLPRANPDRDRLSQLASTLNEVEYGILVLGSLKDSRQYGPVQKLAQKLGWPLLADITSGLRMGRFHGPLVPYYDAVLASARFADANPPKAVLHVGGRLISKRLLDYLERYRPSPYILVEDHPLRQDPMHRVTVRIESDLVSFCKALLPCLRARQESHWLSRWKDASDRVSQTLESFTTKGQGLNEPLVARLISRMIRPGHGLFLAASMPMRDMDTYAAANGKGARVGCNRGASGIDGVLATASGFAQGLKSPVTVLMGDLAFLYDLNSLNLLRLVDFPVIVVILNNNGGGIFSFLPIAQFPDFFEPYFATPHDLTFERAAEMFGLRYERPSTMEAFAEAYRKAARRDRSTVIEIMTDRKENYDLHQRFTQAIVSNLNRG